ncbi:amidohydrolase family protein [Sphingobium fluviale]|uniref:Cytosine deaminase n=1 Tax=Sphingobium fluviale TaxID=2506423 RepID=A0A4Q1KGS5_9SPHN|nr:amidohydrolase family protein [Sphingobium fluviale]RXR26023.1 cytosine deaminase [Sphingobium fluviale]
MAKTLIKNATLLTMDRATSDLTTGDILLIDDRIADVAPNIVADDAETIDATGMVASPGFVDTHRHVWQTQLRGVATDWSLFQYLAEIRTMYSVCYEPEDAYLGNYVGALEMINAGITTVVDHSHLQISADHSDALVQGLVDAGMRGIFCYGVYRNPKYKPGQKINSAAILMDTAGPIEDFQMRNARRVREKFFPANDSLLRFGIASSEFFTFPSIEPVLDELAWSRTLEPARITFHSTVVSNPGVSLITQLFKAGALGDDLLLSHGNQLTDDDLKLLAKEGGWISTTPETELQMGPGFPILERVAQTGRMPSLGVDIVSGFSGDMFAQMRLMLQSMRYLHGEQENGGRHPSSMDRKLPGSLRYPAAKMLEYATLGGATCMGLENEIGTLTPGKKADVILTRLNSINTAPVRDPVAALMFYANANDIDCVWINGVARKRAGRLVGDEWTGIERRIQASRDAIDERFARIDSDAMRKAWAPLWG